MTARKRIIVAGDALIDYQYFVESLPKPGGDERIKNAGTRLGGTAANTAAVLGHLGADVMLLGTIGADANGELIQNHLKDARVDLSLLTVSGETGYTLDLVDSGGERTMLSYRGASGMPFEINAQVSQAMNETAVLLVSGYLLTQPDQAKRTIQLAGMMRQSGGLVAFDPCPVIGRVPKKTAAALLALTDILLPNARELETIQQYEKIDVANHMLSLPCVAVKLGDRGAILGIKKGFTLPGQDAFERDMIVPASVAKQTVQDTTGAGDAFDAGFLWGMLNTGHPKEWIGAANRTAKQQIARNQNDTAD